MVAGRPPDGAQQMVRREADKARRGEAVVLGRDDLRGRPYQHVGVPYGRHAVLGHPEHLHLDIGGLVENRLGARRLRQREERPLHQIALVARCGVAGRDHEGVEAAAFAGVGRLRGAMVVLAQHLSTRPALRA